AAPDPAPRRRAARRLERERQAGQLQRGHPRSLPRSLSPADRDVSAETPESPTSWCPHHCGYLHPSSGVQISAILTAACLVTSAAPQAGPSVHRGHLPPGIRGLRSTIMHRPAPHRAHARLVWLVITRRTAATTSRDVVGPC